MDKHGSLRIQSFLLLLAAKDVSWRNVPGCEELGETAVFACYKREGDLN